MQNNKGQEEKEKFIMGLEEILDAEGADMADAYNDSLPEETYSV